MSQVPLWQSWLLRVAVELRTRLLHQPYGDQALFVRKSTLQELDVRRLCFRSCLFACRCVVVVQQSKSHHAWLSLLQGYKEWKLLEDYELVQRLNGLSRPAIVGAPVVTSGRLYKAAGFWEVVAAHQRILFEYRVGCADPDALQHLRAQLLKKQRRSPGGH